MEMDRENGEKPTRKMDKESKKKFEIRVIFPNEVRDVIDRVVDDFYNNKLIGERTYSAFVRYLVDMAIQAYNMKRGSASVAENITSDKRHYVVHKERSVDVDINTGALLSNIEKELVRIALKLVEKGKMTSDEAKAMIDGAHLYRDLLMGKLMVTKGGGKEGSQQD